MIGEAMVADTAQAFSVPPAELRKTCSVPLDFEHDEPPGTAEACLGQQRAIDAIQFGIEMQRDGYNIFVLGPMGSDRHVPGRESGWEFSQLERGSEVESIDQ